MFTLPHELNALVMGNRKLLLDLLMRSTQHALMKLSQDEKWLGRKLLKLSPLRASVKLPAQVLLSEHYGRDITLCTKCKKGHMLVIGQVFAGQIRDGPEEIIQRWKKR